MTVDISRYRKFVDHLDLSEAEKIELLNAVWMLVERIYDYHLGVIGNDFNFEAVDAANENAKVAETDFNEKISSEG